MDDQNRDENLEDLENLPIAELPNADFPDAIAPMATLEGEQETLLDKFPESEPLGASQSSELDASFTAEEMQPFEGLPEGEVDLFGIEEASPERNPEPLDFENQKGDSNSDVMPHASDITSPSSENQGMESADLQTLDNNDNLQENPETPEQPIASLADALSTEMAPKAQAIPQTSQQLRTGAFTVKVPISSLSPLTRAQIREFLTKMQVSITDTELSLPFLSLSHISEAKAIQLNHFLKTKRVFAQFEVLLPGQVKSDEENQALGVLGEPHPVEKTIVEGAPKIELAGSIDEVILCTGSDLPRFEIVAPLGIVSTHQSLARTFFHDVDLNESMLKNATNPPPTGSKIDALFQSMFSVLQKKAHSLGANAIFSLQVSSFPESYSLDADKEQMRLVVIGTACIVEERNTE